MDRTVNDSLQSKEIEKTKAPEVNAGDILKKDEIKSQSFSLPAIDLEKKALKTGDEGEIKRSNSARINQKVETLKKSAGKMPHRVPKKKASASKLSKDDLKRQEEETKLYERQEITARMASIYDTLDDEERRVFGGDTAEELKRNRFSSLSERDKKKRVDAFMERKANAQAVSEVLDQLKETPWEHDPLDKEAFQKELRNFMMLTDRPFIMDKDDSFARNLKRNYELCETAWKMKAWVSDAVEGDYFPKDFDLSAVEAKIARYEELKEYLDTQSELMQNPYYQYMAKKDFSYSKEQIERLKNGTKSEGLRAYLTIIKKLEGLSFVRRKGMDSVEDKTLAEGKRRAEILKGRTRNRQLLNTFSDEERTIQEDWKSRGKKNEVKFTEEAYNRALENFSEIDFKDLHFKSLADIAAHFKSNARLFEEVRVFERLLFLAARRDIRPSNDEMVKLRAKINAFKSAEYMMYEIQRSMIEKPDDFINEKTNAEFLEECKKHINDTFLKQSGYEALMPGMNMRSYYKNILYALKDQKLSLPSDIKDDDSEKEVKKIQKGVRSIFAVTTFGEIHLESDFEEDFLKSFPAVASRKKLTVPERETRMNDEGSRLFKKRMNAETLRKGQDAARNKRVAARRNIPIADRMALGEENLKHLSPFMTGDPKEEKKIFSSYADEKTRFGVLNYCTSKLLSVSFDIDITNDSDFCANAEKLQEISSMAISYNALIKANPAYLENLHIYRPGEEKSDYDFVMQRLNDLLAISDYFRARSLLISDPYYISRYNDELSHNRNEKSTADEARVADLINLTKETLRRLNGSSVLTATEADMDAFLTEQEKKAGQRAYLFGQPDLMKADISYTKRQDDEIRNYFEKLQELRDDLDMDEVPLKLMNSENGHPFPEAEKYETEAVRMHLEMIKRMFCVEDSDKREKYLEAVGRRKELYDKLRPILNNIKKFEFNDKKTGEHLLINTSPQRIINQLAFTYGQDMPVDEIVEIMEGFDVIRVNKLDENDPKVMAYAKERWLDSMKKLFYLEYNSVKRFESTYGTLPDQLPIGSFMHSLGDGKIDFRDRMLFSQDVPEISDEKKCRVGNEDLSMGEYLVRAGLIRADELSDMKNVGMDFYQTVIRSLEQYHSDSVKLFNPNEGEDRELDYSHYSHVSQLNARRSYDIKGPKLSFGEERKYWMDALDEGDVSLTAGRQQEEFRKAHLNIYSPQELHELKEKRRNDSVLIGRYEETVRERFKVVKNWVRGFVGVEISDELLDRLICFHPAMMSDVPAQKIPEKDNEAFIALVRDYAGIDIPEGERKRKRTEAYNKMVAAMKRVIGTDFEITFPDELIDQRLSDSKINHDSRLMRTLLAANISDSIQSLMKEEADKSTIEKKSYEDFRTSQKKALLNTIALRLKQRSRYLSLKDIGNREKNLLDIELAEVERIMASLTKTGNSLDDEFQGEQADLIKRLYGIEILSTAEILGIEKKEEKKKEKKPAKKLKGKEIEAEIEVQLDPLPEYHQSVNMTVNDYEQQTTGNCWCVAGAALFNHFMGMKIVNQRDMRSFSPKNNEMKSFEELKAYNEAHNPGHEYTKADYDLIVANYREYMGANKTTFGNIYEAADFFLKRNKNIAVRRLSFSLPSFKKSVKNNAPNAKESERILVDKTAVENAADKVLFNKQKIAFLDELNRILGAGYPVAILDQSAVHYRTITKVDGEMITLLDSAGNKEKTLPLDEIFRRDEDTNTIELTWLSELKSPVEEMAVQPNLKYTAEEGYGLIEGSQDAVVNASNPMWVEGVSVTAANAELGIQRSSYLPRKAIARQINDQNEINPGQEPAQEEKSDQEKKIVQEKKADQEKNTAQEEKINPENITELKKAEKSAAKHLDEKAEKTAARHLDEKAEEPAAKLLDEKAEMLVTENVNAFSKYLDTLNASKFGKARDQLWADMKLKAKDLVTDWEKMSDLDRGDALADVLISANRLLSREGKKSSTDKAKDTAAKAFRKFFKDILGSMSTNCRVLALDQIFRKVDDIDDDPKAPDALKKANTSVFTELGKEHYQKYYTGLKDSDNALKVMDDLYYREMYSQDKQFMHISNVKKVFGKTKDYFLANLKFDFSRNMAKNLVTEDIRLDRFGNVVPEDMEKKKKWEELIKTIAYGSREEINELHRRFYTRTVDYAVDPEWFTESGYRKNIYKVHSFGAQMLSLQNYTTDWKVYDVNAVKRAIRKWNKDNPSDQIPEETASSMGETWPDKAVLQRQREVYEAIPSIKKRAGLNVMLQTFVFSGFKDSRGIKMALNQYAFHPAAMRALYQTKRFLKDPKQKCEYQADVVTSLIHRDGSFFDRKTDVDKKGRLVYNPQNPLMFMHEKYQPEIYKTASMYKAEGLMKAQEGLKASLQRIDLRISLFTRVEEDAMKKLDDLTKDKGDQKEKKRLDKLYNDYLNELRIQAAAAETPFQADIDSHIGNDLSPDGAYYPRLLEYYEGRKKINELFDKLERAREDYIKKYAGEEALEGWKKDVTGQRDASRNELRQLENKNTTALERVKKAFASNKALTTAEFFTDRECEEIERNNKKHAEWDPQLRQRVLLPFILPVYRDFSGAYLTEKDRERDDFNRRFKNAMKKGNEEEIKDISREFTERFLPEVTYYKPQDIDKLTPEEVEEKYINTRIIDYETIKLTMIGNVNHPSNTNFPLLKTGLDELKEKDEAGYEKLRKRLTIPDFGVINQFIGSQGFDAERMNPVPESVRKNFAVASKAIYGLLEEREKEYMK